MIIDSCRICGNSELIPILDLGHLALTSVFPSSPAEAVPAIPLELVRCSPSGCGLVQLRHTTDLRLMYNDRYGYRSGIRQFMIGHLRAAVAGILALADVAPGDLVVDIGSNDGTLLRAYPERGLTLVGVDPVGNAFRDNYPARADLIPDFFSRQAFTESYGRRRAKVVTSIAVLYDVPRPLEFMTDIRAILAHDGIWLLEQSYLPAMLANTAFDTVCHEHLAYYALAQIEWMAQRAGLTVIKAELNQVYGGSLRVLMTPRPSRYPADTGAVGLVRRAEAGLGLDQEGTYRRFARGALDRRDELRAFLSRSAGSGLRTLGYGASTKGNVLLQFCGIGPDQLSCIGEPEAAKAGSYTPGTLIPIVPEEAARALGPDQLLVLPWAYRDGFIEREREIMSRGTRLVFPLPTLTTVGAADLELRSA